jgi:hypothetical protein
MKLGLDLLLVGLDLYAKRLIQTRMAYQQSELVNVLGLETVFIRGPDNNPISSQYVLYANGFGQGYWSNAVLPENLSTVSTALGSTNIYITQLSTGQAAVNQLFRRQMCCNPPYRPVTNIRFRQRMQPF